MVIHHNPLKRQFCWQQGEAQAVLEYRYVDTSGRYSIDFYHTWVPDTLRGQGVAAELTQAALAWGRQTGLPLRASCSYVARFLSR